jgi:hypothetical protein
MLYVSFSRILCSTNIFNLSFLNFNFTPLMSMYKFSLEEEMNMSTCNLFETVHNIWLQKSWKRGTCFFAATFDDYM